MCLPASAFLHTQNDVCFHKALWVFIAGLKTRPDHCGQGLSTFNSLLSLDSWFSCSSPRPNGSQCTGISATGTCPQHNIRHNAVHLHKTLFILNSN